MSATPPHTPVNASTAAVAPEAPQLEEDLSVLLDEQAARLKKKRQRANWVILLFLLALGGSGGAWYAKSPENRAAVADLIQNLKDGRKDLAMVTDPVAMAQEFDESLAEINTRKDAIDQASLAMGIDPTNVAEDGMNSEMKEMMGGEGRTVAERNAMLRQKMGGFVDAQVKRAEAKRAAKEGKREVAAAPKAAPQPRPQPVSIPVEINEPLELGN